MPWIQKQTLGVGALVLPPTSRVWGFPEVVIFFERPQKKMARWNRPYRRYGGYSRRGSTKKWSPNQMQVSMLPSQSGAFQAIVVK